jgi:hypothetical protein
MEIEKETPSSVQKAHQTPEVKIRTRLWFTPEGCAFHNLHPRRSCPFFQDHISKKIPPGIAATQDLGFIPMNP